MPDINFLENIENSSKFARRRQIYGNSSEAGFTIVELLIIVALLGFLGSISVPSSLRWVYHEKQNAYVRELVGYMNLVRRESRRWGGLCSFKMKPLLGGAEGKGFDVTCQGINKATRNNIATSIPILTKNVFHEVSGDFNINPKGQISLVNPPRNASSIVIVVGGRHNQSASNQRPKCIVLQSPAGSIRTGVYQTYYRYFSARAGSRQNTQLRESLCISY